MENNRIELLQDPDFIHCSVLIAELLLKYKVKGSEDTTPDGEPNSSPPGDTYYCRIPVHQYLLFLPAYGKLFLSHNYIFALG